MQCKPKCIQLTAGMSGPIRSLHCYWSKSVTRPSQDLPLVFGATIYTCQHPMMSHQCLTKSQLKMVSIRVTIKPFKIQVMAAIVSGLAATCCFCLSYSPAAVLSFPSSGMLADHSTSQRQFRLELFKRDLAKVRSQVNLKIW